MLNGSFPLNFQGFMAYSGLPINVRDGHNAKLCKTIEGPHRLALILG